MLRMTADTKQLDWLIEEESRVIPTSNWRLGYFKKGGYFSVYDEVDRVRRIIMGPDARQLLAILTCRKTNIPIDVLDAFRPLMAEAFSEEFDLSDEGDVWKIKLEEKQPRLYEGEEPPEVYRRYWTGYLMPNRLSALDVAEALVKNNDRVRVALAWNDITEDFLKERIERLAQLISSYHPRGEKGK